jgi:hypothetical protein
MTALPFLLLAAAAGGLILFDRRGGVVDRAARAGDVARYELKRLTAALNLSLNELRDELMQMYAEQLNLGARLTDPERDRLVFFHRDSLAAFAVLVQNESGWDVQKLYVREGARVGEDAAKPFKQVIAAARPFAVSRVDASGLAAPWLGGDAFAVGFTSKDEEGKPFGLVGIFRPSHVFPFCRIFGETLGAMPVAAFILDDRGVVACHSQARYDGTSFKDYQLYPVVAAAASGAGTTGAEVHYSNVAGVEVQAAVRRVDPGGIVLVAEAGSIDPWGPVLPLAEGIMMLSALGVFLLIPVGIFARSLSRTLRAARGQIAHSHQTQAAVATGLAATTSEPTAVPPIDSLGVELSEFTKLKHEIKELETALLDLQESQALGAGFLKQSFELGRDRDLGRFLIDYLEPWGVRMLWLEFNAAERSLRPGPSSHWPGTVPMFRLGVGPAADELLEKLPELRKRVATQLGSEEIEIHPALFDGKPQGFLVTPPRAAFSGAKAEALPQLLQIFAYAAHARAGSS